MASKKLSRSVEDSSESIFDNPCAICAKSGKRVEATKTCLDCRQTLCGLCVNDHNKFDIMKGHRVLDKAMSLGGQVAPPTQMCDNHSGKVVDMFCPQHDRVCCSACMATKHRLCEDVDYVPYICTAANTGTERQTVLQNIQVTLGQLQQRKKERENDKKRIVDEKYRAEKNLQVSATRLIKSIDDMKQKSLNKIHQTFNDFQLKIDKDVKKINDSIASLEEDIKSLQSSISDNEAQLFVSVKQTKEHEELATDINIETGAALKREALHFNIKHHDIDEFIKTLDALCELETPFTSSSLLGRYKIRIKSDKKECFISGLCQMPDDSILATDLVNENLKRLDSSYNIVDHCKLPGIPTNICRTGPTEAAITMGRQQMVQFVSVIGKLAMTSSFQVGEWCRGIAYSRGHLFVTCGGRTSNDGPGEVRVYTTDGKLLHTLPQISTGQRVWSCPLKIALTPSGDKCLVTEEKHGVVTMDRDGSNMIRNQLNRYGICVQADSLWFVGGAYGTNAIFQANTDGFNLGPLLTRDDFVDVDENLYSMFYQRDGDRLIVGFTQNDYIKVFKLFRQ